MKEWNLASITPRPRGKEGDTCCLRCTELWQSVYQLRNMCHVLEFTPMSNSLFRSTGNSTESKAFCRLQAHVHLAAFLKVLVDHFLCGEDSAGQHRTFVSYRLFDLDVVHRLP